MGRRTTVIGGRAGRRLSILRRSAYSGNEALETYELVEALLGRQAQVLDEDRIVDVRGISRHHAIEPDDVCEIAA